MKNPHDFPKALYAIAAVEMVLMIGAGIEMYVYFGQYTTAPAIGSLRGNYSKIGYGLAFPAVIVIGVIYSSVLCQFLYMRFTKNTQHALDAPASGNTKKGWVIWTALVFTSWILGFVRHTYTHARQDEGAHGIRSSRSVFPSSRTSSVSCPVSLTAFSVSSSGELHTVSTHTSPFTRTH